jgi:putative MATE family efflux protein
MDSVEAVARRESSPFKDWTQGSVFRNLLALSWPMVVMESMWVVSQIVDLIWVGRLGSQSMAGVGLANIILGMVMAVDIGMVAGVRAIIARYVGAGDNASANKVAGQALLFGAVWGVFVTVGGMLLARPLLGLFGADERVVAEGAAYMHVMFAGWAGLEVLVFGLYSIQASGDTMTPMAIEISIRALHIALCPFLVMGYWVFPHLGTAGAALSNVTAQVLGAVIVSWVLLRGRGRVRPSLGDLRFAPRVMWGMLKIGVPALLMNIQSSLGAMLLAGLVVPFGTIAVASHTLASRVEMFLYVPGMGLGAGVGVLVGHNLGAGRANRARRGAWLALAVVQACMVVCSAALLLRAESVIGLFSSDPALIKTGSEFLRIATAGYLVMAFSAVLQNSIAGAGDTLPNLVIALASVWALQLPLAFLLSRVFGFGIYGVRWAMAVCAIASAVAYTAYFCTGRWVRKRV